MGTCTFSMQAASKPPGGCAALTCLQRLSLHGGTWQAAVEGGLLGAWAQHAAATLTCLAMTSDGTLCPAAMRVPGSVPAEGSGRAGVLAPLACLRALRCLCLDGARKCPHQGHCKSEGSG